MKKAVTIPVISSLLIFLFGYTAFSKLVALELFEATLSRMPLIKTGAAFLAPAVPLAELVIVLLLFFTSTRLKGLYASAALLSLFTLYLVGMLLFTPHRPCGCGGMISQLGWWEHVGMNAGLVTLTMMGIRKLKKDKAEIGNGELAMCDRQLATSKAFD